MQVKNKSAHKGISKNNLASKISEKKKKITWLHPKFPKKESGPCTFGGKIATAYLPTKIHLTPESGPCTFGG